MKLQYSKTFTDQQGQQYTLTDTSDVFGAKGIDLTIKYTNDKFLEAWQELEQVLKSKGLIKQENDD